MNARSKNLKLTNNERQTVAGLCTDHYLKGSKWVEKVIKHAAELDIVISKTGVRKIFEKWRTKGFVFNLIVLK